MTAARVMLSTRAAAAAARRCRSRSLCESTNPSPAAPKSEGLGSASNADRKCLTDAELKMVLLERDFAAMKASCEYESNANGWVLGLAVTLVASLPISLYTLYCQVQKRKDMKLNHKSLEPRVTKLEAQVGDNTEGEKRDAGPAVEKQENTDETTREAGRSWWWFGNLRSWSP